MAEEKKTDEQLQAELVKVKQEKRKAFVDDYNKLVKKHGVSVVGVPQITPQGIITCVLDVAEVPKEK